MPVERFPGVRASFLAACLAVTAPWAETDPNLDIPATSDAFPVLRRLQTSSGILLPSQAFPQREGSLSAAMLEVATPADAFHLEVILQSHRSPLIKWDDSARGRSFFLSPVLEAEFGNTSLGPDFKGSDGTSALAGLGMQVYGRLAPRLAYYSRGMVYTESTDRPQFSHQFDPDFGETYAVEKGAGDSLLSDRTFDRFEHYLLADLSWLTLKAGRDRLHMGPGYFSSLMANRDTPPYYMLEARIDFAPWFSVDNYILKMTDTDHEIQKFANLHRFEFRPLRGLALAFQDIVVYEGDLDWRYILPLAPLAFTEDNAGGGDNDAMGFDFLYAGIPYLSFWGELFIDDLLGPAAFFDDFWENRWASLIGFQAVSPWKGLDADVVVEYSRVEPWTYLGRSQVTGFRHFNVPSASKLGPDSRSWDVQVVWRPQPWLEIGERFEANAKGIGRPATLGIVHDDSIDGTRKHWLGGEVDRASGLTDSASLRIRQFLHLRVAISRSLSGSFADLAAVGLLATW